MSSCRSTSFYVAPGIQRYFRDATLATYYRGQWHEFTHRRDIENFQSSCPDWDQTCYVGPPGGLGELHDAITTTPEMVELWRIDSRVVNGRAPAGAAPALYNLAHRGLRGVGGVMQLTERLFPEASKPLRNAISAVASLPGAHTALGVGVALRPVIGDDGVATMLREATEVSAVTSYRPVDPALFSVAYAELTQHYSPARAVSLIGQVARLGGLDESGRWALAARTDNLAALTLLARDGSQRVRAAVAGNSSTAPEILALLAHDEDGHVRVCLAMNRAAPKEILVFLSDDVGVVRAVVAKNPATPPNTLANLAEDERESVVREVAENPSTPLGVLKKLLKGDYNYDVSSSIARNLACPAEILEQLLGVEGGNTRARALENPNISPAILREYASRPGGRGGVARNPSFDSELLEQLSTDESSIVRWAVGGNASTPPDVLGRLSEDGSLRVRATALSNVRCPTAALAKIESNDGGYTELLCVAENPSSPPEVLERLARRKDPAIQRGVATNPSCPPGLRAALLAESHDPDDRAGAAIDAAAYGIASRVGHPGVERLREVVVLAQREREGIAIAWPRRPKNVAELPGWDSMPWGTDGTTDSLIGRRIRPRGGRGMVLRRLDSKHELEMNANYMGNCTAGYAEDIASGNTVIWGLDDASGNTVYNVELRRDGPGDPWELGQVEGRFNATTPPPWLLRRLEGAVRTLTNGAKKTESA